MRKALFQFLGLALLIFAVWFAFSRVPWVSLLKIRETTATTEKKLGDLFSQSFKNDEIEKPAATEALDKIVGRLCEGNGLDRSALKIHLVRQKEGNAFALPDGHLIVYSGLISECQNESELAGVLGHEIAHIEKNHVMKRLVNEFGLSFLISIAMGGKVGEATSEAVKYLSSTAYGRELETEADLASVDYMLKARIDPQPFANFLYRLSENEGTQPKALDWVRSHPDSKERAENIVHYIALRKAAKDSILTSKEWNALKSSISDEE